MNKLLLAALTLCFALSLTSAFAADGRKKGPELTDAQKADRRPCLTSMTQPSDGKPTRMERSKMTPDDKAKWENLVSSQEEERRVIFFRVNAGFSAFDD